MLRNYFRGLLVFLRGGIPSFEEFVNFQTSEYESPKLLRHVQDTDIRFIEELKMEQNFLGSYSITPCNNELSLMRELCNTSLSSILYQELNRWLVTFFCCVIKRRS